MKPFSDKYNHHFQPDIRRYPLLLCLFIISATLATVRAQPITFVLDIPEPVVYLPAAGGVFEQAIFLHNPDTLSQSVEIWSMLHSDDGQTLGPVWGPKMRTLDPGEEYVKSPIHTRIPGKIPAGHYTYTVYIGTFPEAPYDSAATEIVKSAALVINEIHYNPPESGSDTLEFIELYNAGTSSVPLAGYTFRDGVTLTLTEGEIAPEDFFVICKDSGAFHHYYGFPADLQWTSGALTNSGECIVLTDSAGNVIDSVDYAASGAWPSSPNGDGPTLELLHYTLDNADGLSWSGSLDEGGTPGSINSVFSDPAGGNETASAVIATPSGKIPGKPATIVAELAAYPNPFNPATRISIRLTSASRVSLKIYDITGRLVRTLAEDHLPAGHHEFTWQPHEAGLASGLYIAHLQAGHLARTMKLVLLK